MLSRRAFLLFALVFPSCAVFTYFIDGSSATRFWYGASKLVQFSLPALSAVTLGLPRRWNLRMAGGEGRRGIVSGILIFAALGALYWFFLRHLGFIGQVREAISAKLGDFGVSSLGGFLLLAAFISVIHSFLEEYYWRGFVFAELNEWLGPRIAYPLAALGFTGHHVVVIARYAPADRAWLLVPIFSGFVFLGGLLWAWLYRRRGSLAGAWLSHIAADLVIMTIGAHLVFGGL